MLLQQKFPSLQARLMVYDHIGFGYTWSPVMPNGIITNHNVSYVPGQSLSTADYSTDGSVSVAIGNNDTTYDVSSLRIAIN